MSSTSQEKSKQIPTYYAMNFSYVYASDTVNLVTLCILCLLEKIKKQFQNECKHNVKEQKIQPAVQLDGGRAL